MSNQGTISAGKETSMDLSVVNKRSIKELIWSAVSFSFFGGAFIGTGAEQMILKRTAYQWTGELLMGFAFLGYGIFWAAMLLRRVRPELPR
jgi:hypothetical protein